jgi:hypothetical protein
VKLFTSKPAKIARESLTIDKESPPTSEGGHQEWRRFVGSIRRKVQRHASTSGGQDQPSSGQAAGESLSRKNSLTQNLFKKEDKKQPVTKQKSIGETTKADLFKALTFKDKSKSASVKHVDSLAAPKQADGQKGVRKSDKTKDSDRSLKSSLSKSKSSANKLKSKGGEGQCQTGRLPQGDHEDLPGGLPAGGQAAGNPIFFHSFCSERTAIFSFTISFWY